MYKNRYYTVTNSSLCFKVLSVPFACLKFKKVKIEWWSKNKKQFWGNQYGLPRYMKVLSTETRFKEI